MTGSSLDYFSHFIPFHTVDFTSRKEVDARLAITESFLSEFPVNDVGFEFIVFPKKLGDENVQLQVSNYLEVKDKLEQDHGTRVHASMHFPTTPNTDLFLGSEDSIVIDRVLSLFERCVDLAKKARISTIVVHSGGNVTDWEWTSMVLDRGLKSRSLDAIASHLVEMLDIMARERFQGKIAWENMPWPFDIPAFTFTNVVAPDFATVLARVDEQVSSRSESLGVCFDACHAFILAGTARYLQALPASKRFVPPGIFDEEQHALLDAADPGCLVDTFANRIVHLHVADSGGTFSWRDGQVLSQLTEGDELGTATFTASGMLDTLLSRVVAAKSPGDPKLGCTLEIKHEAFTNPEKTARSLAWLGRTYFNTRG